MVARDGVEPPTPAFSGLRYAEFLNNLSDFRWPPKHLRSRERHENRGVKSWVQQQQKRPPPTLKGSSNFAGFYEVRRGYCRREQSTCVSLSIERNGRDNGLP